MSSLVFSIPAAPATSGNAPASASGAHAAGARGRDAKPADDANGFGAALARMRETRSRQSDDKADASTASTAPLGRRRALAADDQGKESSPADLLAMAMLTPAFSTQAAQQRHAAASAAGNADAPLKPAIDGDASASAAASTLAGTAAEMAAADTQPAADDKAAKTARASDKDAPADAAADPKAAAKADAASALADPKAAATAAAASPSVPVAAPAAATAAPAAPAANSARDGKSSGASPALASLDTKNASASAAAQVQAKEPSVADQIEGSSPSDTSGNLPAQLAFKTALGEATGSANGNAPAAQSVPRFNVPTPVGSENWGADIGRQMIRMGADGHHVAELNLNPAGLGPLKVTLTMGDGQAQALFASAHESVRRAVEAALPQLRDTLAGQGIQLGQVSVDAGAQQQQQQQAFGQQERAFEGAPRPSGRDASRGAAEVHATAPARAAATGSRSGIDTFA